MAKIVKAVEYTILLYVFLMSEIVSLNIYYIIKIKIGDLCASLNKSSTLQLLIPMITKGQTDHQPTKRREEKTGQNGKKLTQQRGHCPGPEGQATHFMVAGALQEEQACIRDSCINQQVEREFRYSFTKECVSCSDPMRMIMDVYSNETVPPSPPLFSCRLMEIHCEAMKRHKRNSSSGDVWILYEKKKSKDNLNSRMRIPVGKLGPSRPQRLCFCSVF